MITFPVLAVLMAIALGLIAAAGVALAATAAVSWYLLALAGRLRHARRRSRFLRDGSPLPDDGEQLSNAEERGFTAIEDAWHLSGREPRYPLERLEQP